MQSDLPAKVEVSKGYINHYNQKVLQSISSNVNSSHEINDNENENSKQLNSQMAKHIENSESSVKISQSNSLTQGMLTRKLRF